jgi:transcriptional regulator with XRE-family HTH domain
VTHTAFRKLRTEARIPQSPISNRSGVDRSRLSLYECGHISLREKEVVAVEQALRDLIRERASCLIATLSSIGSKELERVTRSV